MPCGKSGSQMIKGGGARLACLEEVSRRRPCWRRADREVKGSVRGAAGAGNVVRGPGAAVNLRKMDLFSLISQRLNLWHPQPISDLQLPVASSDVAILKKELKVLMAAGVIEDIKSLPPPTDRPINKMFQFCQDYQHFNERTLPQEYTPHNIERGLNCLIGNSFFTVLRLDSGIHQCPLYPGEREKPYSVRPLGFYEYERMQPGYCESLARYQAMMEGIFFDMNMVELLAYLDYLIIFGKTFDKHKRNLYTAENILDEQGFKVLRKESVFFQPTVSYAGHEVFEAGFSIDSSKKDVLAKWPKPRILSELQCFLQFCIYYRQFVVGFQELMKPLKQLYRDAIDHKAKNPGGPWWTKESIEARWSKECDEAFYRIKNLLHETTFLPRANMSLQEKQP